MNRRAALHNELSFAAAFAVAGAIVGLVSSLILEEPTVHTGAWVVGGAGLSSAISALGLRLTFRVSRGTSALPGGLMSWLSGALIAVLALLLFAAGALFILRLPIGAAALHSWWSKLLATWLISLLMPPAWLAIATFSGVA